MDLDKNLNAVNKFNEDFNKKQIENHSRRSKERLIRSIETKFKTAFVGAISSFEEAFGHEWGNRVPERDLNDQEYDKRMVWERVRIEIFNKGNSQMRAAINEISEYTVDKNNFTTNFKIQEKQDG